MGYHVGLIPDGNRRWAREHNKPEQEGHKRGSVVLKKAVEYLLQKPEITELSVYILSEENFKRDKQELEWLDKIYIEGLEDLKKREVLHKTRVKVNMITTSKNKLTPSVINVFNNLKTETKIYSNKALNFLIGYTGKNEILSAISHPMNRIKNLFFNLTEKDIQRGLQVKTPCDFIIRSSFEEAEREGKSGFLIWQSAYSEYYHIKKNWGDVTTKDLEDAWKYFLNTKRLKGK